jgi:hypothetical protein
MIINLLLKRNKLDYTPFESLKIKEQPLLNIHLLILSFINKFIILFLFLFLKLYKTGVLQKNEKKLTTSLIIPTS